MEPFDILENVSEFTMKFQGQVKHIRPSNQYKVFIKTYKACNGLKRGIDYWTYFISGKCDPKKARYCAALLMDSYLTHCHRMNEKGEQVRLPYWHSLYGFKDKLIERELQDRIGIPGLLVIDCLFNECTTGKMDRVRDLLSMFSNIPTILIGSGFNPAEMCRDNLYIMPNKMLYLEDAFETLSI